MDYFNAAFIHEKPLKHHDHKYLETKCVLKPRFNSFIYKKARR